MLDIDFDTLATPAIYHRERAFFTEFDPSPKAKHWFGGALGLEVGGLPHGPHPLHRIVTIDLMDDRLGVAAAKDLTPLPLVYGMRYETSDIAYRLASPRRIEIKRSNRQLASNDWPYEGYPDALPRLGLRLLDPVPASLDEFGGLTHQGIDIADPDELIVVVPSIADYGGVSLWGELGWGVQIIFYFTAADRTVSTEHQID